MRAVAAFPAAAKFATLQKMRPTPDENAAQSRARKLTAVAGALLIFSLAACTALFSSYRYFQGGQSYEFCHYSEMAENFRAGEGFTSRAQTPSQAAASDTYGVAQKNKVFDGGRFPLHTLLVAAAQVVFGGGDFAALAAGTLEHALWSAAVFLCGLIYFSAPASFSAALLWALNPALTAGLVPGGLPDLLSGLLSTLTAFLFINALQKRAEIKIFFLIGLLCGATYLSRFTIQLLAPLFPIFAIAVLGWRQGVKACAATAAGAIALGLPWLVYAGAQGQTAPPMLWTQLAANTVAGPVPWQEYRLYGPQDFAIPGTAGLIAWKWLTNFLAFMRELPGLWFLYLPMPAALGFAISSFARKQGPRLLLGFYGAALLFQAVVFSFLRHETLGIMGGRYYLWLGPLIVLAACQFIFELGEKTARGLRWLAFFIAANFLIFGYCYCKIETGSGHPSARPVPLWPELIWARQLPKNSVVLTNIPIQTAWYAKLKTVGITTDPAQLPALLAKHPADYLLLSPSAAGEPWHYPKWGPTARLEPDALDRLKNESGFALEQAESGAALFARIPKTEFSAAPTSAPARSLPKDPARAR